MRTHIIRLPNNDFSSKMANDAIESLESFGIKYELFDGIKGRDGIRILSEHNRYPSSYIEMNKWTDGTIGCLTSHYLLWDKCSKQDEPFLILEQDAVVVRDPRGVVDDVKNVCHLDAHLPFDLKRKNHFDHYNKQIQKNKHGVSEYPKGNFYQGKVRKLIPQGCFKGAYGYIITPKGAKDIISWTRNHGLLPADGCLNHRSTYLQRTNSTYVRLNPFFKTLELQAKHSTR
jgi:GR25 family glycosyltransferase involved in LPS biosynthesis